MKKLMIAAAIVCAAACANAETIWSWNAFGLANHDESDYYTGYATLYAYLASGEESSAKAIRTNTEVNSGDLLDQHFSTDLLAETEYAFYFTADDEDGWTFKSETITKFIMDDEVGTPIMFANASNNGTWTQVPEPTSGLLMLLGMAGLCLRRKQRG